jgi:ATP-binding cassette, subfamily B, bacterial
MTNDKGYSLKQAISRFFQLLNLEKKEITSVYFYAIISGFIILSLPLGIQAITNLLFGGTVSTSLVVLIGIVILGVLLNGVLQIAQMRITERIQQRIFTRLTFAYAYRIPRINLLSIDQYYLPELVNRFFDTSTLQKGFSKLLLDFPAASISILFGLILLCFYHPVFILFAVLIIALVFLIFYFTSPQGFKTSMAESDYKYDVAHWLEEISRANRTFKFNQHNDLHLERTDKLVSGYLRSRDSHFSVLLLQYRVMIGFKLITTAAMLIIGSLLFIKQQINLGQFIASEIIIITVLNSVEKMIVSLEVVYDVLTSLEKLSKVLDKPQDEEPKTLLSQSALSEAVEVKVNDLKFNYPNGNAAINGVSFHINKGEKICITGAEGSGKSTLLKLLANLYPDFSGNILYNNLPLKTIQKDILHRRVSVLLANEELFSGTLYENLTVGNQAIPYEDIQDVCEIVGLTDYILSQQKGFEIFLDPQGKKLSYNIIQKILLARCLVLKPSLILMEDNWMGVEQGVRSQVIDYLTHKSQPFTLIVVSNDNSFAQKCERVLHLENGTLLS